MLRLLYVRKHEADTLASKRLSEALRTALDNHSKALLKLLSCQCPLDRPLSPATCQASEACKGKPATPQHHGTASKAAPFAGGGRPDIGTLKGNINTGTSAGCFHQQKVQDTLRWRRLGLLACGWSLVPCEGARLCAPGPRESRVVCSFEGGQP